MRSMSRRSGCGAGGRLGGPTPPPRGLPAPKRGPRLALALLALLCGCGRSGEAPPPPPPAGPPDVGVVTLAAERVVLTRELPGRVAPFLVAEVRPQVSGILRERHFTEGRDVGAGEALYTIDPAPFKAAEAVALANLDVARKTADRARAALGASVAGVARQEATVALARTNQERVKGLYKSEVVSESERDQATTDLDVAEATLLAAQAQRESDRASVAVADAAIQQAEAALATARIQLAWTDLAAPIKGRIGRSSVTVGALVTAHQPVPLTVIQQLDPVYVDVTQSSVEVLRLRRELAAGGLRRDEASAGKVKLLLEDGTPYLQEGTLQFQEVTVDPTTGSVVLRMQFENPDLILLPGMYVRAVLEVGIAENAILAPQQGVTRDVRGNPQAWVVGDAGVVEPRALSVDRALGDRWLVTQGLSAGDRLVVDGLQKVRPGMAVRAVPSGAGTK